MPQHPAASEPTGARAAGRRDVREARVLVVDDNRVNRRLLVALLRRAGFANVDMAGDGLEALERIQQAPPDLVLLDLMMPHLDGFEVYRRVRADPRHRDLPILVQSSLSRSEDRTEAFACGATDFVAKPVNAPELMARVRMHLENRALLDDLRAFRRQHEADLAVARGIQQSLMPSPRQINEIAAAAHIRVQAFHRPAPGLGGDLWDIRLDADGRPVLWLADVSGRGLGAALHTFRLSTALRRMELGRFDPLAHLNELNRRLSAMLPAGQFARILAGVVDPHQDRFLYAAAGTLPPISWTADSQTVCIGDSDELPLCVQPTARMTLRELPFPRDGRLFLCSSAAIEARGAGAALGRPGLADIIRRHMHEREDNRLLAHVLLDIAATGTVEGGLTAVLLTRSDPDGADPQ